MKKIIFNLALVTVLIACSKGLNTPDPEPDPPIIIDPPAVATLVFPNNGEICADAKDLTGSNGDTDRTYTVTFRWNGDASSSNTIKYALELTNTDDSTSNTYNTTASSSNVSLDVTGINPLANYSWKVVASKNGTEETSTSSNYTFTAAGIAAVSFAPNIATLVNPKRNEVFSSSTTSVDLEWTGSDDNNDIKEYDVYFGETNPPIDKVTVSKDTNTRIVNTVSNKIYYWKIVTRDEVGNESISPVFQFTVAQ